MSEYKIHRTFTKGEKVRVTRIAERGENGWTNGWASEMDKYIGQVLEVGEDKEDLGVQLMLGKDDDYFNFPHFVLELVEENKEPLVDFYRLVENIRFLKTYIGNIEETLEAKKTELNELIEKLKTL